jgi:hypothetical protein
MLMMPRVAVKTFPAPYHHLFKKFFGKLQSEKKGGILLIISNPKIHGLVGRRTASN